MQWGFFSVTHIISLLITVGFVIGMHFLLKKRTKRTQKIVLLALTAPGWISIVWNMLQWGTPLEYLPLHMCAVTLLLLPFAILLENKVIGNLLLLWCLGSVLALVVNTAQAHFELWSIAFVTYYFPHTFEVAACVLLFSLGILQFKPKYILTTLGLTFAIFTCIHFINVGINSYCEANNLINPSGELIQVNYMYSIKPENPVLDLFWSWCPHEYWYMYFCIIIVAVYEGILYLIFNGKRLFNKIFKKERA
jgi:uncharacterized membrane protein YwaF